MQLERGTTDNRCSHSVLCHEKVVGLREQVGQRPGTHEPADRVELVMQDRVAHGTDRAELDADRVADGMPMGIGVEGLREDVLAAERRDEQILCPARATSRTSSS
ncbi:MAG TPA: hypothetical protein VG755_29685 [Nannocystaceae bacterium]|nr:hypothetical protein [Nannocystaceae bacterium]